jgi:hypothetical protein
MLCATVTGSGDGEVRVFDDNGDDGNGMEVMIS